MFKNQGYLINITRPSSSSPSTSSFSTSSSVLKSVLGRLFTSALNPKNNTASNTNSSSSGTTSRSGNSDSSVSNSNECTIHILYKQSCTNTELLQGLLHCYLLQIELYNTPTHTSTLAHEYIIHILTKTLNYVQNIECSSTSLDTSQHHWIRTFFNRLIGGPLSEDGVTSSGRLVIVY